MSLPNAPYRSFSPLRFVFAVWSFSILILALQRIPDLQIPLTIAFAPEIFRRLWISAPSFSDINCFLDWCLWILRS